MVLLLIFLQFVGVKEKVLMDINGLGDKDSRIVHQLRYIQQSIINLTQGKSAAERLRRCKSYPRPPLWASSEVDKHSGVVF